MVALDTNILVRYLLNDGPSECAIAEALLFEFKTFDQAFVKSARRLGTTPVVTSAKS